MAITQRAKECLLDPATPATVLLVLAVDQLGLEVLSWDPETISLEMADLLGTPLPAPCLDKLMTAIELETTDKFYKDLPSFIRICNTLYNGTFDPAVFDPADAVEIAWGITEALLIWPPDQNDESPFTDQIIGYIAAALDNEGIMLPPDVLRLGTRDKRMWESVQMGFSDDPAMFTAIYGVEKARTDEINSIVKTRLAQILTLLNELPLDSGSAEGAVKRMFSAIERTEEQGSAPAPA